MSFIEDFSDQGSGWPVGDDSNLLRGYSNGEYRVLIRRSNYAYAVQRPFGATDYVVSVNARFADSNPGVFGIPGSSDCSQTCPPTSVVTGPFWLLRLKTGFGCTGGHRPERP
jgi:hypothetical protein